MRVMRAGYVQRPASATSGRQLRLCGSGVTPWLGKDLLLGLQETR